MSPESSGRVAKLINHSMVCENVVNKPRYLILPCHTGDQKSATGGMGLGVASKSFSFSSMIVHVINMPTRGWGSCRQKYVAFR